MLRREPTCKDCKKGHYGQVCPCNECGWIHPHHSCPERPFMPEDILTITEVLPEGVEPRKIKLTLPIEGKEWCWLCGSHGPKEICPRRDEINTEFGHQRLKELLQQIVKAKGKLEKGTEMVDKIPGVEEDINFLGTPPFPVLDKKSVGPQLIQPPEGKKPHVKPIEVGHGPQMVMVMVEMVMMMVMMMMMVIKMRKTQNYLLRVRRLRNKLHLVVEVNQQKQAVEEVEDLEVDEGIKVKEDEEGGQSHRVYLVHRGGLDHRDLQDLKDRWDLRGR